MLTTNIRRALTGAGLAVLCAALPSQAQETLKYQWTKGEVHFYKAVQDTSTKTIAMGMEQLRTRREEMIQRFEVKDVTAEGVATVDVSVLSIKIEDDQGGAKSSFDSTRPADQQYEGNPRRRATMDYMGALVGEHYTATIDRTGAVSKVDGMAKIIDKMIARAGAIDARATGNLRATFGDDATRGALERNFKVLPDRPVKQGETWTSAFEQQIPQVGGKMKVDTTTTFAGMEKAGGADVAKITGVMVIDDVPPKEGEATGPAKTTITDGKGTSECLFDPKAGRLVKSMLTLILPIEAQLASGGQGISIKNDTNSKFSFERTTEPAKTEAPKTEGTPAPAPK